VVNSEEENKGIPSEGATFDSCLAIDAERGVGIWGNEKQVMTLDKFSLLNSIMVAKNLRTKLNGNTTIKNIDEAGTIYLDPAKLPDGVLSAIRSQAADLADLVRNHAAWPVIADQRASLVGAIKALGNPVEPPIEPPTPDPVLLRLAAIESRLTEQGARIEALTAQYAALAGTQEQMHVEWIGFKDRLRQFANES